MLERIKGFMKRNITGKNMVVWTFMFGVLYAQPVFAGDGGNYTGAVDGLKTVLTTIAIAIGGVLIIWGAIQFAISFKKMNQQGEHDAVISMAAGAVLVGISAVVSLLV